MPPPFRVQNAEHLADHHHPRFEIPELEERRSLQPGTAFDLHVHGPRPPRVKVRIRGRRGEAVSTLYQVFMDPAEQDCNMPPGLSELTVGPEHVATVYLKKKA